MVRDRYEGIQTVLRKCGESGCLFLSILSIAEEVAGVSFDLINTIHICLQKRWITNDFECLDSLAILNYLTGKTWIRREVTRLTRDVAYNEYTIANYFNPRTGIIHRRRRGYDTIKNSVTVRDGYIKSYYIYSWKAV